MFVFTMPAEGCYQDYYQLCRATAAVDKKTRNLQLAIRGTALFLALYFLYAAEQMLANVEQYESFPWATLLVMILLGGMLLAYTMLYVRLQARRAFKRARANIRTEGVTRFREKDIQIENNGNKATLRYGDITDILHGGGYYFLFVANRQAIIVPEKRIVTGTVEEFAKFIVRKTDLIVVSF